MNLASLKATVVRLSETEFSDLLQWMNQRSADSDVLRINVEATPTSNQKKGAIAEQYIANLVRGTVMQRGSPFDVYAADGTRLEVKYSALSTPRGSGGMTLNWTWAHLLGANRDKAYDHLILVADPNPVCATLYQETSCQYVLFDIPFEKLFSVMNVKHNLIQLNSNPAAIWASKEKLLRLFREFQVTSDQLRRLYGSV